MVVLNIETSACTPQTIVIGRRGTYDTTQIAFDLTYLVESYGSGVAVIAVKRSQDESAYPAVATQDGNTLTWTVSETDTAYVGAGECQLMWYVDDGLAKTIIYPMVVMRDILSTSEEPPDGYENWVESLTALGAETQQHALDAAQSATDAEAAQTAAETAADRAEDALEEFTTPTASATSLAPEAQATAAYSEGHFTFGIPRGAQGATGATPDLEIGTVETLEPDQPATATITGTPENPVLNLGIPKGEKGEGGGGAVESVNGKTGVVVLTAADVGAGTYSKPSGGIPKTDLAAAVQTSLGKADTALQTAPVSSVAGKTGAVTLDAGDAAFSDSATYAAGSIGAEVSQQKNDIDELDASKATVIINTASGDIATFANGADGMPIKHLIANIEPVQSGTGDPSPENIRPISGWTGANVEQRTNLFDQDTVYATYLQQDGSFLTTGLKFSGIRTQIPARLVGRQLTFSAYIKIPSGSTITNPRVCANVNGQFINGTYISSADYTRSVVTFTPTSTSDYVSLTYGTSGSQNMQVKDIQLEVGSAATEYKEYVAVTLPINWQTEAGTVYGGTLDVVTGVLTVDRAMVDLGTLAWTSWKQDSSLIFNALVDGKKQGRPSTLICSQYKTNYSVLIWANLLDCEITGGDNSRVYIRDQRFADNAAFTTAMSGVQLCYELATPQTYQLDPITVQTLLGNNTVYVDCGSVTVDYPVDTTIAYAEQSNAIDQKQDATNYVTLSGTIVTQTGADNTMYLCGELAELTFTAPQTGITAIRFTSGTTPTVATFSGVTWLNGFDPSAIEASKTYEVNILYGVGVASWT